MKVGFHIVALFALAFLCMPAQAQSDAEGQQACGNDVFTLCGSAIPDRVRIAACLHKNYRHVSKPCRHFMANYGKHKRLRARKRHIKHYTKRRQEASAAR